MLTTYSKFSPTSHDAKGLGLPDRQTWLVGPVANSPQSRLYQQSNWDVIVASLEDADVNDDVEIHSFGHWGPGWFEIILIRPGSKAAKLAEDWKKRLENYLIACEDDLAEKQIEEAASIWLNCYSDDDRVAFMRKHWDCFSFESLAEVKSCAQGKVYCGPIHELLS